MFLEQTIAKRVVDTTYDDLDDDLLHTLKRSILDSYAGICASLKDTALLQTFERLTAEPASGSDIEVWGVQKRASVIDALFMNSILSRRSDLLNTYISPNDMGGGHPSDNVALILTLADWLAMNGRDFLTSVYTAFYLSAAFATYYDPESAKYDHDAAASFYTALTIGHAMGLSEEQLTEAQRIGGMLGLDINQSARGEITDWRHCTYASCAIRGLQAVRMARAGFQGPSEIYEGEAGVDQFFPHAAAIFDPPPDLKKIIFKRWPALVFCQTPIDVALDLSGKITNPQTITSVDVKTYAIAFRNGASPSAYHPESRAGRTHSIPYCVAAALLKPIEYEDFDEEYSGNAALTQLISKVKVAEDTQMTKAYPAKAPCSITVTLTDDTTIQYERDYPRGDPHDPLSDQEIENKLRKYFFFAENKAEQDMVIDRLWNIEREESLDWLLAPLKRRRIGESLKETNLKEK